MNITNFNIYDFAESIVASGLPMLAEYNEKWIENEVELLTTSEDITANPHFKRACKLAANPAGSGHNNFLSGIVVSCNVTATVKWWEQFQRYHFKQIVSSQSTMHRLRSMLQNNTASFNDKVGKSFIAAMEIIAGHDADDETLAYCCPMGLELTARITTNYLQLKTIYNQRKNHKLKEWRDFCEWIENLPFAEELITGADK